jgi:hypothetical protein
LDGPGSFGLFDLSCGTLLLHAFVTATSRQRDLVIVSANRDLVLRSILDPILTRYLGHGLIRS